MNAKTILVASLVTLGTISFPESAEAKPRHYRQYRSHPQHRHYYHQHHYHPRTRYYYRDPYYYDHYRRQYYYRPYRSHRTGFYLQYGPVVISQGRW